MTKKRTVKKIECIDCGKKYKDIKEAMSAHDAETVLSHRIKPINKQKESIRVGPVSEGEIVGEVGVGTPIIAKDVKGSKLNELIRQFPQLINPDAMELTRGVEELKELDRQTARSRHQLPEIGLKDIPNFVTAKGLSDEDLLEYLPHAGTCSDARGKVSRTASVITIKCVGCGSKVIIEKRAR